MTKLEEIQRLISLQDTKSNLINLIGTLNEIILVKATDTSELGIYNGSEWMWIGANTGIASGELLMQDGVTSPPVPLENEQQDDWLYEG